MLFGIISAVLLIVCIVRSSMSKRPISKPVTGLLLCVLVVVVGNIFIAVTASEKLAYVGYMLYLTGTDVMFYFFAHFCCEYCEISFKKTWSQYFIMSIVILDFFSVIVNPMFHHVFVLEKIEVTDGLYYSLVSNAFHYVHLAINYILALFCFAIILKSAIKSSHLVASKYWMIIILFVIVAIWESYYIFSKEPIDSSVIGYTIMAIIIYYYAVQYSPFRLRDRMLSEVMVKLEDGIVFYNIDDKCTYVNDSALDILGEEEENKEMFGNALLGIINDEGYIREDEYECSRIYTGSGIEKYLTLSWHRMYDNQQKHIGSYISIHDRTLEEHKMKEQIYKSTHDNLTGIYNMEFFCTQVRRRLEDNPDREYTMVVSDICEFKLVNDVFGHDAGDSILIQIADFLRKYCIEDDVYGRLSNDRFALLMPTSDYSDKKFLDLTVVDPPKVMGNEHHPIYIQMGVYMNVDKDLSAYQMIDRAFMALHSIKGDMAQKLAYYNDDIRNSTIWQQSICASLKDAITAGDIVPYLQAQIDSQGKMRGAEVLVRWNHKTEGFLPPGKFIPVLEEQGLIIQVDKFMWRSACEILRRWTDKGDYNTYLSVNISPRDFYFVDLLETFSSLIKEYDLHPSRLRLEITESAVMADKNSRFRVMKKLRESGFILEMDDFGSGYSSLNMLKEMPIDVLKLDMVFLRESENMARSRDIIESMVSLAHKLDLSVINEGVETQEQVEFLKTIGTEMFQGYYYCRPLSVDEFELKYDM